MTTFFERDIRLEYSDWQQAIEGLVRTAQTTSVQAVEANLRQQLRMGQIVRTQYVLVMSIVLEELGRFGEALDLLRLAADDDPDGAIRYRIGAIEYQVHNYDAAIDAFMDIVDMGASIQSSFFRTATRGYLALALHAAGQQDAARRIARMLPETSELFVGRKQMRIWQAVGLK